MKTITITSFKGGTAKTSTAIHIGSALNNTYNKKVLLIDFDAQANLSTGMGYNPDDHDSIASVLQGEKKIQDVIIKTEFENLDIIPADTWLERVEVTGQLAADRYSHERLHNVIKDLDYDFIIIDTPPSLCWLSESAMIAANHSIICATPEFYSVKGLERLALFIKSISKRHPLNILGVALSFWNPRGKSNDAFINLIEKTFPNKVFSTKIRRDITISEASIYGKPLFYTSPRSRAAEDYKELTNEIINRF